MRTASFALVALAVGLASFVACGGSSPPAQVPATPAAPVVDTTAPRAVGDAGATSTTTDTVAGGGAGTKLTPLAAGDGGADPSHPKHHAELGRSVADIQAILVSHRDEARACYDNALAGHPGIEGTLDVRWTIDPSGNVTDAELDTSRSEIVEPAVANCVVAIVKKIHFNASAKGFETKAHYPWNFHPHSHHAVMGTP